MATVRRPIVRDGLVSVDLAYNDLTLDVIGFACENPEGRDVRLVVRNALGAERLHPIPLTPPADNEPAPAALVMLAELNYHGVSVLTLSAGCTISVEYRR